VEGIGGFFRFAQMRGEGKTVEEILREMNKGAQDDFQKGKERIRSVLQRAFNARKEDGEDLVRETESASDITEPARRRIEASQKTHEELERKIEEIKKALIGLQNQVRESNEKKELLIAKLNDLTLQLQSLTDEPRWMGRGALEKLRKEGREFGSACSRR
jgi:chromosome segregation ATPase